MYATAVAVATTRGDVVSGVPWEASSRIILKSYRNYSILILAEKHLTEFPSCRGKRMLVGSDKLRVVAGRPTDRAEGRRLARLPSSVVVASKAESRQNEK